MQCPSEAWELKMRRGDISNDPAQIKTWDCFNIWDRNEVEDLRAIELYYKLKMEV